MIRYGFSTIYPNGKAQWTEYRSKEETISHAKSYADFHRKRNDGIRVVLYKFERIAGSSNIIEKTEM